jgi:hypothetical protein
MVNCTFVISRDKSRTDMFIVDSSFLFQEITNKYGKHEFNTLTNNLQEIFNEF